MVMLCLCCSGPTLDDALVFAPCRILAMGANCLACESGNNWGETNSCSSFSLPPSSDGICSGFQRGKEGDESWTHSPC
jgi:hypothetical protein